MSYSRQPSVDTAQPISSAGADAGQGFNLLQMLAGLGNEFFQTSLGLGGAAKGAGQGSPAVKETPQGPATPAAAPSPVAHAEAPEAPGKVRPLDFNSFGGFLNRFQMGAISNSPVPRAVPIRRADGTIRDWKNAPSDREQSATSWSVGDDDFTASRRRRTIMVGEEEQRGMAVSAQGNVSVAKQSASRVDNTGKVLHGEASGGSIGRHGINLTKSKTRTENPTGLPDSSRAKTKTDSVSAQYVPWTGETGVQLKRGDTSFAVGRKDDTTTVSAGGKVGPVAISGGVSVTNGVKRDKIGSEGIDATLQSFVGDGTYVEQTTGATLSGGAEVEYGPLGAGGSGYGGGTTKRRHFKAGASDEADEAPQLPGMTPPELEGIDSISDVDLNRLEPGEGYSIEQSGMAGAEGHVKAGITVGLGVDNAEMSQTVLARDAEGRLRVMVSQGDEKALTGTITAPGKVAGLSNKDSTANSASVSFTAEKGPKGEEAVRQFQQTGLLPGADKVAKDTDPVAVAILEGKRLQLKAAEDAAKSVTTGPLASAMQMRIETLRAETAIAAGPVNKAFLERRGAGIKSADVDGVTYDDHTVSHQHSNSSTLSLIGLDVLSWGSSETQWDSAYRDGNNKAHLEKGDQVDDTYAFSANEKSSLVLDPKGYDKGADPVAMVMGGRTNLGQGQRDILARVGGDAFDMPPETLEAWRDGSLNEGELSTIAVTMTESQLARIRDEVAQPDAEHTATLAGSVGTLHEQMVGGGASDSIMDVAQRAKMKEELDQLYQDAANARMAAIIKSGKFDAAAISALTTGDNTGLMLDAVSHVKTTEDFLALTPEEQKLVVTTGAIQSARTGQSSFEAMRLVLQIKDKDQRNELTRQVFSADERQQKGADSAVNFVDWVQRSGDANKVPKEEMAGILSGVAVRTEDRETSAHTTDHDFYEKVKPGMGNQVIGNRLAAGYSDAHANADQWLNRRQRSEERRADDITDLLQAARGPKGDPKAVEQAMSVAVSQNPAFLKEMWATLDQDPARAAWANHMLKGTKYARAK